MDVDQPISESAYSPPITPIEPVAEAPHPPAEEVRPGRLKSSWRGAKTGFRCTSYVAAPLAALVVIPSAALTAFALGSGRGLGIHPSLPNAFGFYLIFAACGVVFGAAAGLIVSLIPLARPSSRLAIWWGRISQPRRLLSRKPIENSPPRSNRRRWPWVIATMVLSILTIAFGLGVYVGKEVDRRLADAIATADHHDPAWRLDDLMANRIAVPDEENSAIMVADVVGQLPDDWPSPTTEVSTAYDRMAATADNVRLDDETARILRDELAERKEAVELARTVANYDRGRHELELGPTLFDTQLPETRAARAAARLLAADAAIRAHDGDLDGSLDSCRAILGVARSIGDEPFHISQLVRLAIGITAMKSARRALGQGESSDAAIARLQALILDELAQPLLLYGLKGERAMQYDLIRQVGAGEIPISALSDSGRAINPDASRAAIAPWGRLMFDNQRAVSLDWMNELVAIARRPPAERPPLWKAWQAEVDQVKQSRFVAFTASIPVLMSPAVNAADSAQSRYQCELGTTAILLAAERHRRKAGAWPASIATIDRALLPNPPLDPFSGKPFLMEHRGGQLVIHSIGPNGKDEHGAYEPKKWTTGGPDDVGTAAWDKDRRRQPPPLRDAPASE